jgi:hypothetical protein
VTRPSPEPGWYPDPLGTGSLRAWDGSQWTPQTRPAGNDHPALAPEASRAEPAISTGTTIVRTATTVRERRRGARVGQPLDLDQRGTIDPDPIKGTGPPKRRRKDGTNAIVAVLLLLFALSGVYEVVTGSSSGNNDPARFATPSTTPAGVAGATAVPAVPQEPSQRLAPLGCSNYPSAAAVLAQLAVDKFPVAADISPPSTSTGLPAHTPAAGHASPPQTSATPARTPTTTLECSAETFTDRRGTGLSRVTIYATLAAASDSIGTVRPGSVEPVVFGSVVLTLSPSLASFRLSYQTAIATIIRHSVRRGPTTTTTTSPAAARVLSG